MPTIPRLLRDSSTRLFCLGIFIGLLLTTTWPHSTAGKVWLGGIVALLLFPTLRRWLFAAALIAIVIAGYRFSLTNIETTELMLRHIYTLLVLMVVIEISERVPFVQQIMQRWQLILFALDIWCIEQLRVLINAVRRRSFPTIWRSLSRVIKRVWLKTKQFDLRYLEKKWPWLIGIALVVLFFIPFTWFAPGEGDYGGDGARLYFLDPLATFRDNLSSLKDQRYGSEFMYGYEDSVAFSTLPFLLVLYVIQRLLGPYPHFLLPLFDGLLLASAFGAIYLLIRDIHHRHSSHLTTRLAAFLGAIFFIFSPIVIYNWPRTPALFHQISVYPWLLWLFLKYLKTARYRYLFFALLFTVVLSVNFGIYAAPVLPPFLLLATAVLLVVALVERQLRRLLRGSAVFVVLFLLLNAWHFIPLVHSATTADSIFHRLIFTDKGKIERGLNYFETVRPLVKLVYNLTAFPQYTLYTKTAVSADTLHFLEQYGGRALYLALVFPMLITAGIGFRHWEPDRRSRLLMIWLTIIWLAGLFFMTANLFEPWGPRLYQTLFTIPGAAAVRSFYGAFAISFMLSYALTLGLSLRCLLSYLHHPLLAFLVILMLAVLTFYQALPFVRGQIFQAAQPDTKNIKLAHRFPTVFLTMVEDIKKIDLNAKFITLPLTHFEYQIIEGDQGGAYVGPSPLTILAGKQTFSGFSMFDFPNGNIFTSQFFFDRLRAEDYRTVHRLLALLNIGFIFENSSPQVYLDHFIGWPYSQEVWQIFPTQQAINRFIQRLGYHPILNRASYTLYDYPEYFLPRLYVPRTIILRPSLDDLKQYLVAADDYDIRTALYETAALAPDIAAVLPAQITQPPAVEYRAVSESIYYVRLHNIRQSVPLVFSQVWHRDWKLRVIPYQAQVCGTAGCADGLITAGGEKFISPNLDGVIQNENLPPPSWRAIWGAPAVDERYHLRTNEYANSWWLDLAYVKKHFGDSVAVNADGSYDIELVLEYTPQRYFYFGILVSILTLLGLGTGTIHSRRYARLASKLGTMRT